MYLLYLDDAGSVSTQSEAYFVLGGVCIPESSVSWLNSELEKLALEINPTDPRQVEFHASEIFGGRGGIWSNFKNKQDRIDVIKKVLLVLQKVYSDTVVFACAVHKKSFPTDDPVAKAFEDLSSRFDLYVQKVSNEYNHKGIIILDKSTYETSLQNLSINFRKQGNRWGSQIRAICEVPLFVDSRASRIIQLADHVAYSVFRRYNAGDLTYFNCIESNFYYDGGQIHGLVHRQTYNRHCTCPACITRRGGPVPYG